MWAQESLPDTLPNNIWYQLSEKQHQECICILGERIKKLEKRIQIHKKNKQICNSSLLAARIYRTARNTISKQPWLLTRFTRSAIHSFYWAYMWAVWEDERMGKEIVRLQSIYERY
jgi:hypothetical protein